MYYRILSLLAVSLLIHLLLYTLLNEASAPNYQIVNNGELDRIDFDVISKAKSVVMQADAPDLNVMDHSEADLLSKEWQRVHKMQRAAKTGDTANRSPNPVLDIRKKTTATSKKPTLKNLTNLGDMDLQEAAKPKPVDYNRLASIFKHEGESTVGERLSNNIPIGDFTALNTDAYKFYSFHSRVNESIRPRWVNHIEKSLADFKHRNHLGRLHRGESITVLEIILDAKGNYQTSLLRQTSGTKAWDEAAVMAFQNGAPYLNPPKDMIEKDGKVHLLYSFSVFWDPQYASMIQ